MFQTIPTLERWTSIPMAIFSLAAQILAASSDAFARRNAQIGNQTPTFDQNTLVNLGGFLIQGGINGIGLCGQTFIAVDRSGTATNNNIYMLASVVPNGQNTTEVMFARSTDGGLTFSAPVSHQ